MKLFMSSSFRNDIILNFLKSSIAHDVFFMTYHRFKYILLNNITYIIKLLLL